MNTLSQDRPRVLVVDDQKNWREALCEMLDPTYEIETAATYDEAKRRLRQRAFHVLVTDQRLVDVEETNIQGIFLLDEVNKFRDGTQAIIVTGYPTIEAVKKALKGRAAYDYMLKYPEEGGPFNIKQYREQVKGAVEKAKLERQKATTLGFSVSSLIAGLTYERIAETLFPENAMSHDALKNVGRVLDGLLYPHQPLARQMGRVWLAESDQICEILCWSRNHGKVALIRIGKEQLSLEAREVKWLTEKDWYLIRKSNQLVSGPVVGISYMIDEMTFEDFATLVEED